MQPKYFAPNLIYFTCTIIQTISSAKSKIKFEDYIDQDENNFFVSGIEFVHTHRIILSLDPKELICEAS